MLKENRVSKIQLIKVNVSQKILIQPFIEYYLPLMVLKYLRTLNINDCSIVLRVK